MKILAIDPGYERLGIAVLEKEKGGKETLLFSECFKTSKKETHTQRLLKIGEKIEEIIKKYSPKALAIENIFLQNNQKTVMYVSETKGIILYMAEKYGLFIKEFSPPQIKLSVTGNGKADKKAMIKMVPLLVQTPKNIAFDDEYDAIAIGLCFFAHHK